MTPGRHPPERSPSAALSGLVLFEAGELIPVAVYEADRTGAGAERPRGPRSAQREARDRVGQNLRRAFPLPDSGSFAGLLDRLEET